MKNNLPKFLLAENPMLTGDHDGRLFIIHLQNPFLVAELHHREDMSNDEYTEAVSRGFGAILNHGPEIIIFVPVWIAGLPNDPALAGLMRRMADWYKAYLIWEYNQEPDI